MEQFSQIMTWLDDFVWGIPMIVLLLGTHLFMTLRTGFIQRKTLTGIKLSVTKACPLFRLFIVHALRHI